MSRRIQILKPPFWSRIPMLGVRSYPSSLNGKIIFWLSSIVYSLIYFYLIALVIVVFTHALWTWSSFQSYITTTLFDIVYKNLWLVIVFVIVESFAIYTGAKKQPQQSSVQPYKTTWRTFVKPLAFVAVMYFALKLITKSNVIEPNFWPVIAGFYLFLLAVTYSVDKYIPRT